MDDLFYSRNQSIEWVKNDLKEEFLCVTKGFSCLFEMIEFFEKLCEHEAIDTELKTFYQISGVVLASFTHYLLGILSLCLDALGHEAGALLRPAIEAYELLIYLQQDRKRVNQVIEDKLPSGGRISQIISGDFQELRNYYNKYTSHFSARPESIKHLISPDGKIEKLPAQNKKVLFVNLEMINAFQIFMINQSIENNIADKLGSETILKYDLWIENSKKQFSSKKFSL